MPPGAFPLRVVQFGKESARGTLVPATFKARGQGGYVEQSDRYRSEYPRGVFGHVNAGGVPVRGGAQLPWETEVTYEELPDFLQMALTSAVTTLDTPSAGFNTHAFDRDWTTQWDGDSYTMEYEVSDGAGGIFSRRSAFAFVQDFQLTWALATPLMATFNIQARAAQDLTLTPALAEIAGRQVIPSDLFKLYIDDSWATLGTTQMSEVIRAATLNFDTGIRPDFTFDGQTDLDFVKVRQMKPTTTLQITFEHDSQAAAEIQKWRETELRFLRLQGGKGTKQVTFDLAGSWQDPPTIEEDEDLELTTMTVFMEYDEVGADQFEAEVVNEIASY